MTHIAPPSSVNTPAQPAAFSAAELAQFTQDGYVIVPKLAQPQVCHAMIRASCAALAGEIAPLEYEADVHYPGAPLSRQDRGGNTVRRLLHAYQRDALFRDWALNAAIIPRLRQLLGPQLMLVQAHHNCIMTKQPHFSSQTQWHQDIRYWAFARPELINVWLALTSETPENGCLMLIPGSHQHDFARERFDDRLFLRPELPENQRLLQTQITARLNPGDVLFFHGRTFHAAGRNQTEDTKFSLVFTYHAKDNLPQPGTRSQALPEVPIP